MDLIRVVRRAALELAKADPALTSILPAGSIFPSLTPLNRPWPFARLDGFNALPFSGRCYRGSAVTFRASIFAKPRMQGASTVETAEDYATRISALFTAAMNEKRAPITGGSVRFIVRSSQYVADPDEADAARVVLSIEARAMIERVLVA